MMVNEGQQNTCSEWALSPYHIILASCLLTLLIIQMLVEVNEDLPQIGC